MTYKQVESYADQKPDEVDTTSSSTTVYLRKNIQEVSNSDQDGNDTDGTHWRMEEAQLTHEQYQEYLKSKEMADMMAEASSGQNEEIMQALSDAEADRELRAIAEDTNTETVMQAISDLQADIAMMAAE
jgi:hypothetical protein